MPRLTPARLSAILAKGPRVIFVRGTQEARLHWMYATGAWGRIDRAATRRWTPERAERLTAARPSATFAEGAADALRAAAEDGTLDRTAMLERAERIARRDFSIFSAPLPREGPWPWLQDWRFGTEWPPGPANGFSHYGKRDQPYDVKFPWELNRLQFLLPLLQGAVLDPASGHLETALAILEDWRAANPLAGTVNWNPMETSMRAVTLVMALEMARAAGASAAQQAPLLADIDRCAHFVERTIEDTDIRGNHYTASVTALLVAGAALGPELKAARRWFTYAATRLDREILGQILPDGVNFEKATYYHRLVSDLFLVCDAVATRFGSAPSDAAKERLRESVRVMRLFQRPDGFWPIIGDSDDAEVFTMDSRAIQDHGATLAVAAALYGDPALAPARPSPASVWMTGTAALPEPEPFERTRFLDAGGFAIIREDDTQLIVDVGEVGLAGRGGHGHNDILSFDLSFGGRAVIIDPGSYIYTGDLAARERFRRTDAHNGLVLDGAEIASLDQGPFRVSPEAVPLPATMTRKGHVWYIEGGHGGYRRLDDPALHHRRFAFDPSAETLEITDRVESGAPHAAERFLHFAADAKAVIDGQSCEITLGPVSVIVSWDEGTTARLDEGEISDGYAQKRPAPVLVLSDRFGGDDPERRLRIERVSRS